MKTNSEPYGDRRDIDSGIKKFMATLLVGFILQLIVVIYYAGVKAEGVNNNTLAIKETKDLLVKVEDKLDNVKAFANGVALNSQSVAALADTQRRILTSLDSISTRQQHLELKLERHLGKGSINAHD